MTRHFSCVSFLFNNVVDRSVCLTTDKNHVESNVEKEIIIKTRRNVFRCVNIVLLLRGNQTAQNRSKAMETINQLEQHVNDKSKKPK